MKHPFLDLRKHNAELFTSSDGMTLRTAAGRTIGVLKHAPDPTAFEYDSQVKVPKPSWAVQHALNSVAMLDNEIQRVSRDERFSDLGRREQLAPVRDLAIKTLSAVAGEMRSYLADLTNASLVHYAVPAQDRQDIVGFLRESEIRSHLRSLDDKAKAAVIRQLFDGSNPDLDLAVLRSPVPFEKHLAAEAERGWHAYRDRADSAEASRIALGKASADWSGAIVQVVANTVTRTLEQYFDREILANVAPAGSHELFGLKAA